MTEPDYYGILHVDPSAPEEVIRASYLTLMKRLKIHPDLGGKHDHAILLNKASETLSDSRKRLEYDQRRRQQQDANAEGPEQRSNVEGSEARSGHCLFCGVRAETLDVSPDSFCHACGSPIWPVERGLPDVAARRATIRMSNRQKITLLTSPRQRQLYTGESLDLSPLGMCFLTKHRLRHEQVVQIDSEACCAVGRVAYISLSSESHVAGVQFLSRHFKRSLGTFVSVRF